MSFEMNSICVGSLTFRLRMMSILYLLLPPNLVRRDFFAWTFYVQLSTPSLIPVTSRVNTCADSQAALVRWGRALCGIS